MLRSESTATFLDPKGPLTTGERSSLARCALDLCELTAHRRSATAQNEAFATMTRSALGPDSKTAVVCLDYKANVKTGVKRRETDQAYYGGSCASVLGLVAPSPLAVATHENQTVKNTAVKKGEPWDPKAAQCIRSSVEERGFNRYWSEVWLPGHEFPVYIDSVSRNLRHTAAVAETVRPACRGVGREPRAGVTQERISSRQPP